MKKLASALLIIVIITLFSACGKNSFDDPLNKAFSKGLSQLAESTPQEDIETVSSSSTTTSTPKEDLTNPVCLEYFLWNNYEKTYTDGSESITFAYQEPDGGGGLRSTYPDIQYIANFRPGTELHFRVYKDREEAIARGVNIKFEANDMILCGYQDADVKYGGHINGVGYDTNFEWTYDGSLVEERFEVHFARCAVIGMNPYIKVTISTDGYKNKTFNIKVNRSDYYRIAGDGSFNAEVIQVIEGAEDDEPNDSTPRITLYSDKTFRFVCSHLNRMETYIGTWSYCVINDSIYEATLWVDTTDSYMPVDDEIRYTSITLKFEPDKNYVEYSDTSTDRYAVFGMSSLLYAKFRIGYFEPVY